MYRCLYTRELLPLILLCFAAIQFFRSSAGVTEDWSIFEEGGQLQPKNISYGSSNKLLRDTCLDLRKSKLLPSCSVFFLLLPCHLDPSREKHTEKLFFFLSIKDYKPKMGGRFRVGSFSNRDEQ